MRGDSTKNWQEKQKEHGRKSITDPMQRTMEEEDAFPNNSSAPTYLRPRTSRNRLWFIAKLYFTGRRRAEQSSTGRQE